MSGGGGKGGDTWRPTPVSRPQRSTGSGSGSGSGEPDPCAIVELAILNSPDRAVLATLRPGDLLIVDFQAGPPQRLVAVQQSTKKIAGSITSSSMLRFIECINERGNSYVAEVLSVRGASCQVRVQKQ